MRSHGRNGLGFLISLAAVVLAGCNGTSPTEPSAFTPIGLVGGSLSGEAVVSGELVQGGGALSSESVASTAAGLGNIRVSVVGTSITDMTDSAGRFRLANTPDGNLQLQFVGGSLNAQLALQGVTEALAITVQVQGSSVQLVSTATSALERFNELVLMVTVTDPTGTGTGTLDLERTGIVMVDGTTWWDTKGDYFDLATVQTASVSGVAIKIKGQGTLDPGTGMIMVSQIRAKIQTPPDVEFDGPVASASGTTATDGTMTLVSNSKGPVLQVDVDGATVWDTGGDYLNLTDFLTAVNAGILVNVEGDGTLDASGTFILAGTIKAEDVVAEFDGPVASASGTTATDGILLLVSNSKGPVVRVDVDAATVWDLSGDYLNLTDLLTDVNTYGLSVHVEGDGALDTFGVFILAGNIKAERVMADFDGPVATAGGATPTGTITLVSNSKGPVVEVLVDAPLPPTPPPTVWDPSGDYVNQTDLVTAVTGGTPVKVEGDGQLSISGVFILAYTIKAEDDTGGCAIPGLYDPQIVDIQTLRSQVLNVAAANGLNGGQTNSLTKKLDNAIKSLTKCNSNAARGQLGAFINEVDAYGKTGKIANPADAVALIQAAQAIIASLP